MLVREAKLEEESYKEFQQELSERHARGDYFYSVTSFIYYGEKINF